MRLTIVSVPVSDQQRAKAFYRDVLGFTVTRENPMGKDMTWVQMMPPEGAAGITLVTWFEKLKPGDQQGLVLETDDLDKSHAELAARGLEIGKIADAFWGRFATFSDPDGNSWVLAAPKPE
jgi:catechol 2,3-dioxygenase-like lactoylglutathione lyase family enzyme